VPGEELHALAIETAELDAHGDAELEQQGAG
jgi:hypothetical protein